MSIPSSVQAVPARAVAGGFPSPRLRRLASPVLTAASIAAVIAALRAFVLAPLLSGAGGYFEDFRFYYDAGHAANAGLDPYAAFDPGTVTMSGFVYPPFGALLMRPLALLDHRWAVTLWMAVGVGCTLAGAVLTARSLLPASWPRARLAVLAVLLFAPATHNLWVGQANPIVFVMLALALRSWVRGDEVRCGLWLGLAAGLKVAPVALVVLFVRRGWWRGAASLVATTAATFAVGLAVLGAGVTRSWVGVITYYLGRDDGWLYNQTWNAVLSRLANHSVLSWAATSPPIHIAATVLGVAGLLAAAWAVRPGDRPREVRGAEFGAGVAAMVLAGSIAWYAHDIHLVIPLVALVALLAVGGPARRTRLLILAASVAALAVVVPVLIDSIDMPGVVRVSEGPFWWPYMQIWSLPALASIGLLAVLVHAGVTGGRSATGTAPAGS